jgi:hypothetical protein
MATYECDYELGTRLRFVPSDPRIITQRETASSCLIARVQDLKRMCAMDAASWRRSEHRTNRLIKVIVLIFLVAVAVGLLACATLALVGLDCPNANPRIVGRKSSVDNGSTQSGDVGAAGARAGSTQSGDVGAAGARAYVTACATMRISRGTAFS